MIYPMFARHLMSVIQATLNSTNMVDQSEVLIHSLIELLIIIVAIYRAAQHCKFILTSSLTHSDTWKQLQAQRAGEVNPPFKAWSVWETMQIEVRNKELSSTSYGDPYKWNLVIKRTLKNTSMLLREVFHNNNIGVVCPPPPQKSETPPDIPLWTLLPAEQASLVTL